MNRSTLFCACSALCAVAPLAGCRARPVRGGGGDAGTSGTGGTTGGAGGTTGGGGGTSGFAQGDGNPPSEAQLCLRLWAGERRAALLGALAGLPGLTASTGPGCRSLTPAQAAAYAALIEASGPSILALEPPDGGWPPGSGPDVCLEPATAFGGLPARLSSAIASGSVLWNAAADATCQQGLGQSADLLFALLPHDGGFPGEASSIYADGGGPCTEILVGAVADGGACRYPFECKPGLFCHSDGTDGSCAGSCAPIVPLGTPCGRDDLCAGGGPCLAGVCGGPDGGGGPSLAPLYAPCGGAVECQGCLACLAADGGLACQVRAQGASCSTDSDCGDPLLYCDQGGCEALAVPGAPCGVGSPTACIGGWCEPVPRGAAVGICLSLSAQGGACLAGLGCGPGLFCAAARGHASLGACAPYPLLGDACGTSSALTTSCPTGDYCAPADGGGETCQELPSAGEPCPDGRCAEGTTCDAQGQCRGLPGSNDACEIAVGCAAGLRCVASGASGLCQPLLPTGSSCTGGGDCLSGQCVASLCAPGPNPCLPSDAGCQGQEFSFVLGLGGAVALLERRRARGGPAPL